MSTVWRMVDDTDPRLSYQGTWNALELNTTLANQLSNGLLPNGPVFNRTLHEARENVSVSFTFEGSGFLGVYGSLDASGSFNPDDTLDQNPSVSCSLDGIDIGSDEVSNFLNFPAKGQGPVNNNFFCVVQGSSTINGKDSKFQPGTHVLQINVTNPSQGTMGWFFDYITFESMPDYVPENGEVLQAGKVEVISNVTDYGMLSFPSSQGWNFDTFNLETKSGNHSDVTLSFNGTSVSLFAGLFGLNNGPFANGFYQVDNLDPMNFSVPILDTDASNQLIWTADKLSSGSHAVLTSFNVSSQSDLFFGYFLVNAVNTDPGLDTTTSSMSTSSSTGVNPTSTTGAVSPTSSTSKHLAAGAIAGIVLGTCILILILIGAFILWRRSQRRPLVAMPPTAPFPYYQETSPSSTSNSSGTVPRPGLITSGYQPTSSGKGMRPKGSPALPVNNSVAASSTQSPSGLSPDSGSSPGLRIDNVMNLKLQQRLVVMEERLQAQDAGRQMDQMDQIGTPAPIIHMDSGVRLTTRMNAHTLVPEELPPGYTEQ